MHALIRSYPLIRSLPRMHYFVRVPFIRHLESCCLHLERGEQRADVGRLLQPQGFGDVHGAEGRPARQAREAVQGHAREDRPGKRAVLHPTGRGGYSRLPPIQGR